MGGHRRGLPAPQRRGRGPWEGKPGCSRPGTPETPREGGGGRSSVSPKLCNRGAESRTFPPASPAQTRPPAPTPPHPNQKRKEPRLRSGVRGEVRAPPIPRGRHFVTSLASQQARATRAPPTRPAARPPAASSALRASLPSGLFCLPRRGVAHRAARGRAHRKVAAAWTAGTWSPRPPELPGARPR